MANDETSRVQVPQAILDIVARIVESATSDDEKNSKVLSVLAGLPDVDVLAIDEFHLFEYEITKDLTGRQKRQIDRLNSLAGFGLAVAPEVVNLIAVGEM